jgi:hypothetical protein
MRAHVAAEITADLANRSWLVRAVILGVAASAMLPLGSCMPATVALPGPDPADPAARGAPVGYRSTVGPYTPMRPAEPKPWRGQDVGTSEPR